jgi:hypothetical protein
MSIRKDNVFLREFLPEISQEICMVFSEFPPPPKQISRETGKNEKKNVL